MRKATAWLADEMAARAITEYTDGICAQRYEVPAVFFAHVLGPNRKYSCCFYKETASTLQEAEEEAMRQTVEHADLADGQSMLELGCGLGRAVAVGGAAVPTFAGYGGFQLGRATRIY